ncbi:putative oxidoreductase [Microthyrium microscopicum]|uniref:Putative oxidoreductase n=1 Tax=Microthyrium microscopicum TaxID=703497 RepID=A0A6A6UDN2_9PEZI|nr:putative oxidoreductase [Microthyrium microscopicum]
MANTSNGIKIIYGAGGVCSAFVTVPEGVDFHDYSKKVFETLKKDGITTLDTAEFYPGSEEEIGLHGGANDFTVDTKLPGGLAPPRKKDEIIAGGLASLAKLKTKQVDVLYFHKPETTVPFEEQLEATNELYKQGAFKRLGISNYTAEQVQQVYDISKKNGYPLPTVYQGNYSAVARLSETTLLPTLRKLGIAYYAYSPIAGGFLAKTRQQVKERAGRFDPASPLGDMWKNVYDKPSFLDVLDKWGIIADDAGVKKAELAYRWVIHHSALEGQHGDGVIFGANSQTQLEETVKYVRAGPLSKDIADRIRGLWDSIKHEVTLDGYNSSE